MKIRLTENLASGAAFVAPVLVRRLLALPKDPSGSHVLTALGATMQVEIEAGAAIGTPPDGTEIRIRALKAGALLPVFDGTLRVEPIDTFSSRLVLAGIYRVPFGSVGAAVDRTILAGAAKQSLRTLLHDVRAEIAAAVTASAGGTP